MGGAVSAGDTNDELIDNLVDADYIKTPLIAKVFRAVDRAEYYLPGHRGSAYKDLAWKHGNIHLSAPCIYAEVMESLKLSPGLSFLNLGSGTGYLSTLAGLIIGPYGSNHGVECHTDVVQYARERLENFKSTCVAFDEFEFGEPQFTVGNCLLISTERILYDRVYCGAACPLEQENFMKNLLKVGGILVMPLNDQLVQITRVSDSSWETKGVLPVSFASLVIPSKEKPVEAVQLPEGRVMHLHEISRLVIRRIIRKNVEVEHPELANRSKRNAKRKQAKAEAFHSTGARINIMPMDMEEEQMREEETDEGDQSYVDAVEQLPSEPSFKQFMREKIELLPVPSALKGYLLFYRET
ncbi:hypothetical protein CAPTEDRAFT_180377 [Capitella teleta]|uniref:Protein-L-isoaspartate O-methyltransferase domain-containing protein n=1 Tax=Capitella teleta TaxID=283909 RepID=R7UXM3_CAPTE|nr:hypothetical protein CAPTEDRAFT_180377 [Capitella teleta]|eukprot:ELU11333.1 hypothetical protein CAPTEDRAFT_180377 [Capitella teleta]